MSLAQLASFKIPAIELEYCADIPKNENMKNYPANSSERAALTAALDEVAATFPQSVPVVINGERQKSGLNSTGKQLNPSQHSQVVATYEEASDAQVDAAIQGALDAKKSWEAVPWNDKAAIFLKAADLISTKYRYTLMAATMLGQGKNTWQAEIDAAAELADFLRFGVKYVEEMYAVQPPKNAPTVWNRTEYRPLEGFVLAVSPFNFTAIGGNLPAAPALVGNTVVWKPSPMASLSNYIVYQILEEAGLPKGVIQFVPGPPAEIVGRAINNPNFAALHFTGSTHVFKNLWKNISNNLDLYKGYPRIVGETGGKNFHLVHNSAPIKPTVVQTIRAAFEYQGQKCSACSRLYVPASLWKNGFEKELVEQVNSITVGKVQEWNHFMGPVINKPAFDKITGYIKKAQEVGDKVIAGGTGDDSEGYFVKPTVILTTNPKTVTMTEEIFGPVITAYVYEDDDYEKTAELVDQTTTYALTGALFARDRAALIKGQAILRNSAGNFYLNDKCTGAVVGQQPFGGARASGTNDKAGAPSLFSRFVSARSIKETFVEPTDYRYPSNY
ncbi:hypothetical protein E3Q23_04112 [Wallemia mellicola]|uniref:Multifunctional fusion protein n=1 Tax=Wallemia mellicola TaxID=1708541 RepID=A0A4T0TC40_9BASI|nr:hypothetical protein E3Q23_04112 [Wallemia mellicola]TIC20091.1 delta-1-pyrroline-5-carboxylate dehydrogenase [Wallemia mellicola]TIC62108.1 delta-1-pyrroline-5-carboxylate dehydrogenase [Wallemia mellicola]TIC70920.1 delta-1-pyrroline-5-carboxylate dehydrogenase [Wallemia mellicola]